MGQSGVFGPDLLRYTLLALQLSITSGGYTVGIVRVRRDGLLDTPAPKCGAEGRRSVMYALGILYPVFPFPSAVIVPFPLRSILRSVHKRFMHLHDS